MGSAGSPTSFTIGIPPPLPPSQLPPADSPNLVLAPATQLERDQCQNLNFVSWGGPLSTDQYMVREEILEREELTANGRITFWILTIKDSNNHASNTAASSAPEAEPHLSTARPILAACESILKYAYVAKATVSGDAELEQVLAHGIASVYCRPEYRKLGYASRMMSELGRRLETWQQPPNAPHSSHFSILFSDVGKKFYARHGWTAMPSNHISLPPINHGTYSQAIERLNLSTKPTIRDLHVDDIENFCKAADARLKVNLKRHASTRPGVPHAAIKPDRAHMLWHFAREEYYAREMYGRKPLIKGAMDDSTGVAILWGRVYAHKPQDNQLLVLHYLPPADAKLSTEMAKKSIAALLASAQLEANDWDMHSGVEWWNPDETTVTAAQMVAKEGEKVEIVVREKEHICSLRWTGGTDEEVVWLANEKYGWC